MNILELYLVKMPIPYFEYLELDQIAVNLVFSTDSAQTYILQKTVIMSICITWPEDNM